MHPILKYSLALFALVAVVAFAAKRLAPVVADRDEAAVAHRLLAAIARDDYGAFVSQGDGSVRKLRPEDFSTLVTQHGQRLAGAHQLTRIEDHWRGSFHITRWRLTFPDGATATMTLGIRDGRVATFGIY
jgi:hypothetical protein